MINLQNNFRIVLGSLSLFSACLMTISAAHAAVAKTTVVYFGQVAPAEFQEKVEPLFQERSRSCKGCVIVNHTPYKKTGEVDYAGLKKKIESLPESTSFVFFDFNLKVNDQNRALVEALNKRTANGLVVVGTAGLPPENEASGPLSRTILGQVHGAIIIGELTERDRLPPTGFYGPEMLTALRSPRNLMGQGYSPLIFAANLAQNWNKKDGTEWVEYLKNKKMKTRKLWLDMGDLF